MISASMKVLLIQSGSLAWWHDSTKDAYVYHLWASGLVMNGRIDDVLSFRDQYGGRESPETHPVFLRAELRVHGQPNSPNCREPT